MTQVHHAFTILGERYFTARLTAPDNTSVYTELSPHLQ